jgi:ribose 5-phosphate isomerase B
VRVFVGSDHAGFELKGHLLRELAKAGHDVVDVGPEEFDPVDDYPPYCVETGRRTVATPEALGVVIGGSGNGEQIAANKVPGIRAALAWNIETAKLARQHNNAQIVAIGARQHSLDEAAELAAAFVAEPFSEDPRHQRRIDELAKYEKTHEPPALPRPEPSA